MSDFAAAQDELFVAFATQSSYEYEFFVDLMPKLFYWLPLSVVLWSGALVAGMIRYPARCP